jgi:hypothetical protein
VRRLTRSARLSSPALCYFAGIASVRAPRRTQVTSRTASAVSHIAPRAVRGLLSHPPAHGRHERFRPRLGALAASRPTSDSTCADHTTAGARWQTIGQLPLRQEQHELPTEAGPLLVRTNLRSERGAADARPLPTYPRVRSAPTTPAVRRLESRSSGSIGDRYYSARDLRTRDKSSSRGREPRAVQREPRSRWQIDGRARQERRNCRCLRAVRRPFVSIRRVVKVGLDRGW